jgi:hypothetical protein
MSEPSYAAYRAPQRWHRQSVGISPQQRSRILVRLRLSPSARRRNDRALDRAVCKRSPRRRGRARCCRRLEQVRVRRRGDLSRVERVGASRHLWQSTTAGWSALHMADYVTRFVSAPYAGAIAPASLEALAQLADRYRQRRPVASSRSGCSGISAVYAAARASRRARAAPRPRRGVGSAPPASSARPGRSRSGVLPCASEDERDSVARWGRP